MKEREIIKDENDFPIVIVDYEFFEGYMEFESFVPSIWDMDLNPEMEGSKAFHGSIKWDGCAHYFSEYFHICGFENLQLYTKALELPFTIAARQFPEIAKEINK